VHREAIKRLYEAFLEQGIAFPVNTIVLQSAQDTRPAASDGEAADRPDEPELEPPPSMEVTSSMEQRRTKSA
jgi:hypothetical protein